MASLYQLSTSGSPRSRASGASAPRASEELAGVQIAVLFELRRGQGFFQLGVGCLSDLRHPRSPFAGRRGCVRRVLIAQGRQGFVVSLEDLEELLLLSFGEAEILGQAVRDPLCTVLDATLRALGAFFPSLVVDAVEDVPHGRFEDRVGHIGARELAGWLASVGRGLTASCAESGGEQGDPLLERANAGSERSDLVGFGVLGLERSLCLSG